MFSLSLPLYVQCLHVHIFSLPAEGILAINYALTLAIYIVYNFIPLILNRLQMEQMQLLQESLEHLKILWQ